MAFRPRAGATVDIRARMRQPGLDAMQRRRRDLVAAAVGDGADDTRGWEIVMAAGRVRAVPTVVGKGGWVEARTELDREIIRLDSVVGGGGAGVMRGCCMMVLVVGLFALGLQTHTFDQWVGRDLDGLRQWWVYGLVFAVGLALWRGFDYLGQWRRYLNVRPRLRALRDEHKLRPSEMLARTAWRASQTLHTLPRFLAADPDFTADDHAWPG